MTELGYKGLNLRLKISLSRRALVLAAAHLPREADSDLAAPEVAAVQVPDGVLRIAAVAPELYEAEAARPPRVEVTRQVAVTHLPVLVDLVLQLLSPIQCVQRSGGCTSLYRM